jgi:hypothetical protein
MSLIDRLGIDLGKTNAKELEDAMKGNGLPAIGLHHAVLDGYGYTLIQQEVATSCGSRS